MTPPEDRVMSVFEDSLLTVTTQIGLKTQCLSSEGGKGPRTEHVWKTEREGSWICFTWDMCDEDRGCVDIDRLLVFFVLKLSKHRTVNFKINKK